MPKECKNCVHKSDFKSAECGVCMVSYYDGEQIGLPSNFEQKPQTNADRIRAMSDEELCKFLGEYKFCDICEEGCENCTYHGDCDKRLLDWLQQPAEVDNGR